MERKSWKPSAWDAELAGCVWMQRMLDKGRRALQTRREGRGLMNGYLFGQSSFMDAKLLRFLKTDESRVTELLSAHEDDTVVAGMLVAESGRSPAQLDRWNRRVRRRYGLFNAMCDADEGVRPPGFTTSLLKFVYNKVIMPPVYAYSRWAERRRAR